jgi:hypothetical protein
MERNITFEDGTTDLMKNAINERIDLLINKLKNKDCINKIKCHGFKNGTFSIETDCNDANAEKNRILEKSTNDFLR